VYTDRSSEGRYRVAIKTKNGWMNYGHFINLSTASYVANIAILIEESDLDYTLNEVGRKDPTELQQWRMQPGNQIKEKLARQKFAEREQRERENEIKRIREIQRKKEEKAETELRKKEDRLRELQTEEERIARLPTSMLVKLSEKRHLTGREHRAIRDELEKRSGK
jgi:hypothetical protein